jgi:hypothetical protein
VVSLAKVSQLDLGWTLISTGVYNILTGECCSRRHPPFSSLLYPPATFSSNIYLYIYKYIFTSGWHFGVPMPVQPMKAISAIAIDRRYGVTELCFAGIFTSSCVWVLGFTRLINIFHLLIPLEVIRGIQVSTCNVIHE